MLDRWFMTSVNVDNELYWMTELSGHMMKMNIETLRISYVFPKKFPNVSELLRSSFVYSEGEVLYAFLNKGEGLLKYNIKKNACEYIYLGLGDKNLDMCAYVTKYKDELVVIPVYEQSLLRINLVDGMVRCEEIINSGEANRKFAVCEVRDEHYIFIATYEFFSILRYDLETGEVERLLENRNIKNIVEVIYEKAKLFFLTADGDVYVIKEQKFEKIYNHSAGILEEGYAGFCVVGNKIWIMPLMAKDIIVYDMETSEKQIFACYPNKFKYNAPEKMGKYPYKTKVENKIFFSMHAGNYIFTIDAENGQGQFLEAEWPDEMQDLEEINYQNAGCCDEAAISLATFICGLRKKQKVNEGERENGKQIWKIIKGL